MMTGKKTNGEKWHYIVSFLYGTRSSIVSLEENLQWIKDVYYKPNTHTKIPKNYSWKTTKRNPKKKQKKTKAKKKKEENVTKYW